MKKRLTILFSLIAALILYQVVNALPPAPPSSTGGIADGSNATLNVANITTLNVSGVTGANVLNGVTANITGTTTANVLNVITANITSIKTAVAADNTLSGTPIIITVYDAATNTPYYFKAYPTKP